ncbi:hypothetical protein [Flavobacterium sp. GT3R68]|uniref:hypothetical protein n=1 Tax=Flavobacterium sp. GT3R68 TaxID=2594437 RepID=UPI000F892FDB|nr:hypothetical protein [Flavobacterium sp. GT3R68]RTY96038.1 hypothetical protein EKL32_05175 [Flavobacterium sp. GSN2]TRW93811.1 hypothetical protein FNW07_02565 [Flavobacterium sp. GT3R68]
MRYIGLIDDRERTRTSLRNAILLPFLTDGNKEWDVIDIEPLSSKADYQSWVLENEISVLIIDEKLNESSVVDYLGHDVVILLRAVYPELPIFCITAAKRDDDLNENYKNYNFILSKSDFEKNTNEWVNLFVKSGSDFYDKYSSKKDRLSELAAIVSSSDGEVSPEIKEEMNKIQEFLSITHNVDTVSTEAWLREFSAEIKEFDELLIKIESNLK